MNLHTGLNKQLPDRPVSVLSEFCAPEGWWQELEVNFENAGNVWYSSAGSPRGIQEEHSLAWGLAALGWAANPGFPSRDFYCQQCPPLWNRLTIPLCPFRGISELKAVLVCLHISLVKDLLNAPSWRPGSTAGWDAQVAKRVLRAQKL